MPDDPQDTPLNPALDNPNPQDNPTADPPDDPSKKKPFTPEQEQYLGSWFGRIVSKQIEEKVLPHIQQPSPRQPSGDDNDQVKRFNEEMVTLLLENPMEAFTRMNNVYSNMQSNLSKGKQAQLQKTLTSFSEKPLYKEVFTEMKQIAEAAVNEGYPPEAATEYAYYKAKANYLEGSRSGGDDDGSFGNMGGGIHKKTGKKPVLPERFKEAARRAIEDGYFKDEDEYIKALHPSIRSQYGI